MVLPIGMAMNRMITLLAAAAGVVIVLPGSRQADACSREGPLVLVEQSMALTEIPTSGLVPIYVRSRTEEVPEGYPRVGVYGQFGVPVDGTVDLTRYRLTWRAAKPLAPQTTYAMTIEASEWEHYELSFTTALDDAIPPLTLAPSDSFVREFSYPTASICCNHSVDSCSDDRYEHCWTQTADYRPTYAVSFELDRDSARFYQFVHDAPGAAESHNSVGFIGGGEVRATYPTRLGEYCVTLTATPLAGGVPVENTMCLGDAATIALPPFVPEQPTYEQCRDAPVNPETGEEVDRDDNSPGSGCGVSGKCSLGAALLAFGLLFGSSTRRRRSRH